MQKSLEYLLFIYQVQPRSTYTMYALVEDWHLVANQRVIDVLKLSQCVGLPQ